MTAIVPVKSGQLRGLPAAGIPYIVVRAGANAVFAAEEFFQATLNNLHTRRAYEGARQIDVKIYAKGRMPTAHAADFPMVLRVRCT